MTAARRNMWIGIAVVAAVQVAVLCWMIWDRNHLLTTGREIVLEVIPVDPRSLFQGDYVVLGYDISRVDVQASAGQVRRGDTLYVTLQKQADGKWKAVQAGATPPTGTSPDQVVLKGKVQFTTSTVPAQSTLNYGIENYFVPEGTGRELEKLVGDKKMAALIAVDGDGNAGIKGLIVDGQRVYVEPLFLIQVNANVATLDSPSPRVTGLPLPWNFSPIAGQPAIESGVGICQCPRPWPIDGEWQMGLRVALGMIIAATAATAIGIPTSSADETGMASMHTWRREGGRTCMSDHWHYGSSGSQRSRSLAQRAAIRSWVDFTDLEYGSTWARWGRAASKRMGCSGSGTGWTCDAEARPCR